MRQLIRAGAAVRAAPPRATGTAGRPYPARGPGVPGGRDRAGRADGAERAGRPDGVERAGRPDGVERAAARGVAPVGADGWDAGCGPPTGFLSCPC